MSRYVITISPDNDGSADAAHTTVRVDTSTGQTRITELTVRASTGGGLAPADLPPVDLDLLVRALTATAPSPALVSGGPTPVASEPIGVVEPREPATERTTPARRPRGRRAAPEAAEPAERKARGRKAAAGGARRGRKATPEVTERRARKVAQTSTRAYRRMPEPDEVMAAYQAAGTITGVAEHFGVPRHTVAGWARRLREQGYTIGRA
ncbi:helix-turn-helix domain containing protein [Micromonospora sp. CPCC 205371]|nr:helix-turn-helix domain containing protein [Micromonospora sp. CPCC 205371]